MVPNDPQDREARRVQRRGFIRKNLKRLAVVAGAGSFGTPQSPATTSPACHYAEIASLENTPGCRIKLSAYQDRMAGTMLEAIIIKTGRGPGSRGHGTPSTT